MNLKDILPENQQEKLIKLKEKLEYDNKRILKKDIGTYEENYGKNFDLQNQFNFIDYDSF